MKDKQQNYFYKVYFSSIESKGQNMNNIEYVYEIREKFVENIFLNTFLSNSMEFNIFIVGKLKRKLNFSLINCTFQYPMAHSQFAFFCLFSPILLLSDHEIVVYFFFRQIPANKKCWYIVFFYSAVSNILNTSILCVSKEKSSFFFVMSCHVFLKIE